MYAFQDLFFIDDKDSCIDGAYKTFSNAADDCMFLEVNEATVKIWVNLDFEHASEDFIKQDEELK